MAKFATSARKQLVIDTSYSLEAIKDRELDYALLSRDIDGYLQEVWSVHPFATLVTTEGWAPKFGSPTTHQINDRHFFVEGKIGQYAFLDKFKSLNFLVSQIFLAVHLIRVIQQNKITCIKGGDPLYSGLFAWLLARACKLKFIIRVGSNNEKIFESTRRPISPRLFVFRQIERLIERRVLTSADLVLCANRDNYEFARNSGARDLCTAIVRYGTLIHPCHLTDPEGRGIPLGDPIFAALIQHRFLLYIGRLEPVKLVDHVLRTFLRLRQKGSQLKLLLCGEGSLKNSLLEAAAHRGLEGDIIFAGNRPQTWLAQVIPLATVVLSPHTGRALCEVAYGASPVVAYDIDWQSELVEDGITGRLVNFGNEEAFADACEELIRNHSLAKALGENLRKRVLVMMDSESIYRYEQNLYEKLIF